MTSAFLRALYDEHNRPTVFFLRQIASDIDGFDPKPTHLQKELLFKTRNIILDPAGSDWTVVNTTEKMEGHSVGLAMCIALMLFNSPGCRIVLFSKTYAQGRIIQDMVMCLLRRNARAKEFEIDKVWPVDVINVFHIESKSIQMCSMREVEQPNKEPGFVADFVESDELSSLLPIEEAGADMPPITIMEEVD